MEQPVVTMATNSSTCTIRQLAHVAGREAAQPSEGIRTNSAASECNPQKHNHPKGNPGAPLLI